jgi:hypothetical protein
LAMSSSRIGCCFREGVFSSKSAANGSITVAERVMWQSHCCTYFLHERKAKEKEEGEEDWKSFMSQIFQCPTPRRFPESISLTYESSGAKPHATDVLTIHRSICDSIHTIFLCDVFTDNYIFSYRTICL